MVLLNELLADPKKIQISVKQYLMLMVTYIISTADVFLPSFVAQEAKEDSWLSVIFGTIGGLLIVNILVSLALKFPMKTLAEYACDILGKPVGKVIGFLYAWCFFIVTWTVVRELEEVFGAAFNSEAPILVYGIVVMIVATFAVFKGLEVIARINEILLPIGLVILALISIVNIPNININYLLPVMYNGIFPSLKGGLLILTWLIETIILLQLTPYIKEKEKVRKYSNIAVVSLGVALMIGVLTITVFGSELTGKLLFAALEFVRISSIGQYFQNLDIAIMVVWISGIFVKISLAYYLSVQTFSQVINSKSQRSLIIPIGLLILVFSAASAETLTDLTYFLKYILPFYFLVMALIIPGLLLIIVNIDKRISKHKMNSTNTEKSE